MFFCVQLEQVCSVYSSVAKEKEDPEGRVPIGHGTVIYGNLMEQLQAADMGLPKDCDTDDITWI
ncbi:hypothetical protein ccbrp13_48210 [Ktedonobacteria bacterium brp13]|nr:hypothetical protein ccbrp13_48210 [Ktedonobacteria bacterium brp13]